MYNITFSVISYSSLSYTLPPAGGGAVAVLGRWRGFFASTSRGRAAGDRTAGGPCQNAPQARFFFNADVERQSAISSR
jgi:hypothetical protein